MEGARTPTESVRAANVVDCGWVLFGTRDAKSQEQGHGRRSPQHPAVIPECSRCRPFSLFAWYGHDAFGVDTQASNPQTFLRERRLLLSWAKAGKDSKESREATRSEGDDLEESAARALMRHRGRGRSVRGEGRR